MTTLDINKIYSHDELLGYIRENGGTFTIIYEVQSVSFKDNNPNMIYVSAANVLIDYKGKTYMCDHLWFNTRTMRDECIRVNRQNGRLRKKGKGVKGLVRMIEDCTTTTYYRKDGTERYGIYKEPAPDGPDDFIVKTSKQMLKEQIPEEMYLELKALDKILNQAKHKLVAMEEQIDTLVEFC